MYALNIAEGLDIGIAFGDDAGDLRVGSDTGIDTGALDMAAMGNEGTCKDLADAMGDDAIAGSAGEDITGDSVDDFGVAETVRVTHVEEAGSMTVPRPAPNVDTETEQRQVAPAGTETLMFNPPP